jgi:hypothetical protein
MVQRKLESDKPDIWLAVLFGTVAMVAGRLPICSGIIVAATML